MQDQFWQVLVAQQVRERANGICSSTVYTSKHKIKIVYMLQVDLKFRLI